LWRSNTSHARLQIELLFDAGSRHRLAEFGAVPLMHESDIVHDEHTRLPDALQILIVTIARPVRSKPDRLDG
jgi:hypothetical protein